MKALVVISILLSFIMMNACTQKVESDVKINTALSPDVYAIHNLELKPEVDTKEFEKFVLKELAPIYNKMKGQKMFLAKGDRGERTDKYALILTFESVEDRDRIYPSSGEFTEDFGDASIWDKFESMTVEPMGTVHTDYVRVNHQN